MMFDKIVPRLLLGFFLLSPLPLAGLAYFFIDEFEQSQRRTVLTHLVSLADKKYDQIDTYLYERLADTRVLANASITQEALHSLSNLLREEPVSSVRYRKAMNEYRNDFIRITENHGYYDLLLIDKAGNVVFSILSEDDLGSNLDSGPLRNTKLAEARRNALALLDSQLTQVAPYGPSGHRPAVFIVTPLLREGTPEGTVALQLDLEQLISISADNTGLGVTGETVLAQRVDDDVLYLGALRRINDASFNYRVPLNEAARPMRHALLGSNGTGLTRDYAGVDVVAAWRYLPFLGWGMVVKMNVDEAFAEVLKLHRIGWAVLALLMLLSAVTALIFGRALLLPIRRLTEAAGVIAGGDIKRRVPVEGWKELKELAGSFNRMTDQMVEDQRLLERRVELRTAELEQANRRLNDLLTLHEAILDNAAQAIIATTPEGVITVFNRAAEVMLGYSPDEMIGKRSFEIIHDRSELERRALEVSEQLGFPVRSGFDAVVARSRCNLPDEEEWIYRHKEGRGLPVLLSVAAMRDANQTISGYLCVAVDIGKIKTIEQELRDSETRFRTIFEKASIGIAFTDAKGRLLQVNGSLAEMLECPAEKLLACNFLQLTYPDDLPLELKLIKAIRQGRCDDYRMEKRYLTQAGRVVWCELAVSVIRDEQGRPVNYVGMIVDITARKESEIEYRVILGTTQDGFGLIDMQGRFVDINDAYCRLIGYSREELLRMSLTDVEAFQQAEETKRHIDDIFKVGSKRFETQHRRKDGVLLDIEVSVNYLPVANGRLMFFLRDIGARKEAEAALLEAKQNAEAANRAKSAFLANMSHEIRTPMNAILGLTQLVLETELNARQKDFLHKVQSSSKALLSILNDILDYSKIEAGRLEIERIPFRIEPVLMSVADLFAARIEEKGLELFCEIAPEIDAELLGDPMRLTQVLNNLVGNAVKFTERGEIHIRVEMAEQRADRVLLRFTVRDTGIGLSRDLAEQLFQPFTQADSSITRQFGGTGLGLAICRKLVELMGGSIGAAGIEGKGAVFTFTMQVGISEGSPRLVDVDRIEARRVLVVDDQETSRTVLERLLTGWGIPVETASSGKDALTAIHRSDRNGEPFSIVLLDWRMHGMSGLDVARQLDIDCREGRLRHPLTVVMVTSYDKEQLMAQAGTVQIDKILTKPVLPSVLFNTLTGVSLSTVTDERSAISERLDGLTILVVEDNALNQQVVHDILNNRGAAVSLAENGQEALAMLESQCFDLVLMDLQMPVMDGFEATRRIKALPYGGNLPVIAMSAAVLSEERERCRAAGTDDFVAKPVDPKELARVILKWCGKSAAHMNGALPVLARFPGRDATDELGAAAGAIEGLLESGENAQPEYRFGDAASIAGLLCDLIPYLEEQELIPETLSDALAALPDVGPVGVMLKRLRSQLDRFDHGGALATVEGLLIVLKQGET